MSVTQGFPGGTAARQEAVERMALRLSSGGRVIVGTVEALPIGCAVGKSQLGRLLVKSRATRAEFLEFAPDGAEVATAFGAPFYWELELEAVG